MVSVYTQTDEGGRENDRHFLWGKTYRYAIHTSRMANKSFEASIQRHNKDTLRGERFVHNNNLAGAEGVTTVKAALWGLSVMNLQLHTW